MRYTPHTPSDKERMLRTIGPEAIPGISQLLRDANPTVRYHAVEALDRFGPEARPARAVLQELLHDKVPGVRRAAARALSPAMSGMSAIPGFGPFTETISA